MSLFPSRNVHSRSAGRPVIETLIQEGTDDSIINFIHCTIALIGAPSVNFFEIVVLQFF